MVLTKELILILDNSTIKPYQYHCYLCTKVCLHLH